jgi:RimJ/RimL family protein N-acetyltransferase
MHVFPVETQRLRMRPISAEDEALFVSLYCDEETMRFIGAPLSAERAARSFRLALAGMEQRPIERLFLTVIEQASLRPVGICSLQNWDSRRRSVQGGVMFIPTARALGYSKDAFVGLIPRVFAELPVDELWVQFAAGHLAVQRAVISVGFTRRAEAGLGAGPERHNVWSVCRDSWVAPRSHDREMTKPRVPDDICDGKQA